MFQLGRIQGPARGGGTVVSPLEGFSNRGLVLLTTNH